MIPDERALSATACLFGSALGLQALEHLPSFSWTSPSVPLESCGKRYRTDRVQVFKQTKRWKEIEKDSREMANPARTLFFWNFREQTQRWKETGKELRTFPFLWKKCTQLFWKNLWGEMERKGGSQELGMRARGMSGRVGGKKRLAVCSGVERVVGISGVSGSGSQPASQRQHGGGLIGGEGACRCCCCCSLAFPFPLLPPVTTHPHHLPLGRSREPPSPLAFALRPRWHHWISGLVRVG